MGMGIAEVAARRGCSVVAVDTTRQLWMPAGQARRLLGVGCSSRSVGRLRRADRPAVRLTSCLDVLASCLAVVEAVVEVSAVKFELFGTLGGIVLPERLLAANASSIPVIRIASRWVVNEPAERWRPVGSRYPPKCCQPPSLALRRIIHAIASRLRPETCRTEPIAAGSERDFWVDSFTLASAR
jgi:hypothetical protein